MGNLQMSSMIFVRYGYDSSCISKHSNYGMVPCRTTKFSRTKFGGWDEPAISNFIQLILIIDLLFRQVLVRQTRYYYTKVLKRCPIHVLTRAKGESVQKQPYPVCVIIRQWCMQLTLRSAFKVSTGSSLALDTALYRCGNFAGVKKCTQ